MQVLKEQVVNDVIVLDYSNDDYAKYLKDKEEYKKELAAFYDTSTNEGVDNIELDNEPPTPPEIKNALEGLRIMDVQIHDTSNLTQSPIETGVNITDCQVRMPIKITIKGICDNIRGPMEYNKKFVENRTGGGMIGSAKAKGFAVVDAVTGYEFEAKQSIETRARAVYAKLHKMKRDKTRTNGKPKTWIVSTKGAVYSNMRVREIEQLNDWEHLMVIPVTIQFEELILAGGDNKEFVCVDDADVELTMGGSLKKGNILKEAWSSIKEAF